MMMTINEDDDEISIADEDNQIDNNILPIS